MNNKEAKHILELYASLIELDVPDDMLILFGQAYELAIKALEERSPKDLSEYSDKLWKKAYERGKAEGRKTGHWYEKRIDEQYGNPPHGFLTRYEWRCSECEDAPCYEHDIHTLNFCPNCGADMRVKDELNNERPQGEERMFNPYDHRGITEI